MTGEKNDPAVVLKNLSKVFQRSRRLRVPQIIREGFFGELQSPTTFDESAFWAIRDLSFSIPRGQILGLIGSNGAGKTTLLRLLAGLCRPTLGELRVNGRISAMLNLVTALNPDLSGRKNIQANGIYQGYSLSEVRKRTDSIIEFADLGEFIDHPVRTYSSGMQARLSFSIVTGFGFNEVLLVDEALGAGDARFAPKAAARMREYIEQGRTVVVVSHSMETIRALSQRVIWLDNGTIRMDGEAEVVIDAYQKMTSRKNEQKELARFKKRRKTASFDILNVELQDQVGRPGSVYEPGAPLRVRIEYDSPEKVSGVRFRIDLRRADGALISTTALPPDAIPGCLEGRGQLIAVFDQIIFAQGSYFLKTIVETASGEVLVETQTILHIEDPHFHERGGIPILLPALTWQWDRNQSSESSH